MSAYLVCFAVHRFTYVEKISKSNIPVSTLFSKHQCFQCLCFYQRQEQKSAHKNGTFMKVLFSLSSYLSA